MTANVYPRRADAGFMQSSSESGCNPRQLAQIETFTSVTARPFDPFPHDAAIHPSSGRLLDDLLDEFVSAPPNGEINTGAHRSRGGRLPFAPSGGPGQRADGSSARDNAE